MWRRYKNSNYVISSSGEIMNEKTGRSLKGWITSGYKQVTLLGKNKLVHRVVYETFTGDIPEGMQIHHIDANRLNNNIDNLRLVTVKENLDESRERNGDTSYIAREKLASVSNKEIAMMDDNGNIVMTFKSAKSAGEYLIKSGLSTSKYPSGKIGEVANGKRKSAYGYLWEWLNPNEASRSL